MSISGSNIGTRPFAKTCRPTSNCCCTTASMPATLARLITERSFVPKMPAATALSNKASNAGISFMSCTPSFSSCKPLSIFRKGTTFLSSHKYCADGFPQIWRSMVASKRMAPIVRWPLNFGLVMMRVRISCTLSYICSSPEYSDSSMPYNLRASGVLPPLWSNADKKPLWNATFAIW